MKREWTEVYQDIDGYYYSVPKSLRGRSHRREGDVRTGEVLISEYEKYAKARNEWQVIHQQFSYLANPMKYEKEKGYVTKAEQDKYLQQLRDIKN